MISNDTGEITIDLEKTKCKDCGASLIYKIGTKVLTCEYCTAEIIVESKQSKDIDRDLDAFLTDTRKKEKYKIQTVQCKDCGASTTLQPHVVSDKCPYCTSPLIIAESISQHIIEPNSLIPFNIDKNKAWKYSTHGYKA